MTEIAKKAGEMWRGLEDKEREVSNRVANQRSERYHLTSDSD